MLSRRSRMVDISLTCLMVSYSLLQGICPTITPQELQITGFQKSLFGILIGEHVKFVELHFGHTGIVFKINLLI